MLIIIVYIFPFRKLLTQIIFSLIDYVAESSGYFISLSNKQSTLTYGIFSDIIMKII